jgi:hypothetical protein
LSNPELWMLVESGRAGFDPLPCEAG